MSVTPTITLEMNLGAAILDAEDKGILDAEGNYILDGGWSDIIGDTRSSIPIHIKRGNFGGSQLDRVADIGTLSFALDNSEHNSAGLLGYYSPSNANLRSGFGELVKSRVSVSYGSDTVYKFQGVKLDNIDPDSGQYERRLTSVTAVDWMDEAHTTPAKGLEVQLYARDDSLINLLLSVMENQPEDTNLSIGSDQYGAAFSDVRSENMTIASVFQSIAQSGVGTIFLNGSDSTGEILTYKTRHDLLSASSPVADIDNSMVHLSAPRASRNKVREVIAVTHPTRIDSSPTAVLFSLQQQIEIPAGETRYFTGRYTDPNNNSVRITGTDIVTPLVAGTHFNFSSTSGAGDDLNGSLGVSIAENGDATNFALTNNGAVTGFLWFLEIVGRGVYLYDQIEHSAVDTTVKKGQTLFYNMVYQNNFEVGSEIASAMLEWETEEKNERVVVHFKANRNAALMAAAILVEPGDLVTITETVTGVDRNFFANGIELDIKAGGRDIDVYWYCVPAQTATQFCILDVIGKAELGTTAILGF